MCCTGGILFTHESALIAAFPSQQCSHAPLYMQASPYRSVCRPAKAGILCQESLTVAAFGESGGRVLDAGPLRLFI